MKGHFRYNHECVDLNKTMLKIDLIGFIGSKMRAKGFIAD